MQSNGIDISVVEHVKQTNATSIAEDVPTDESTESKDDQVDNTEKAEKKDLNLQEQEYEVSQEADKAIYNDTDKKVNETNQLEQEKVSTTEGESNSGERNITTTAVEQNVNNANTNVATMNDAGHSTVQKNESMPTITKEATDTVDQDISEEKSASEPLTAETETQDIYNGADNNGENKLVIVPGISENEPIDEISNEQLKSTTEQNTEDKTDAKTLVIDVVKDTENETTTEVGTKDKIVTSEDVIEQTTTVTVFDHPTQPVSTDTTEGQTRENTTCSSQTDPSNTCQEQTTDTDINKVHQAEPPLNGEVSVEKNTEKKEASVEHEAEHKVTFDDHVEIINEEPGANEHVTENNEELATEFQIEPTTVDVDIDQIENNVEDKRVIIDTIAPKSDEVKEITACVKSLETNENTDDIHTKINDDTTKDVELTSAQMPDKARETSQDECRDEQSGDFKIESTDNKTAAEVSSTECTGAQLEMKEDDNGNSEVSIHQTPEHALETGPTEGKEETTDDLKISKADINTEDTALSNDQQLVTPPEVSKDETKESTVQQSTDANVVPDDIVIQELFKAPSTPE